MTRHWLKSMRHYLPPLSADAGKALHLMKPDAFLKTVTNLEPSCGTGYPDTRRNGRPWLDITRHLDDSRE
jgi:hypothetical protein